MDKQTRHLYIACLETAKDDAETGYAIPFTQKQFNEVYYI